MNNKVWFITGASKGFGRIWTEAALKRGDRVAATARNTDDIKDLTEQFGELALPLELDVTNRDKVFETVKQAHEHFGRLDVVVNNAGYGQFGMIEELTEEEAREQFETNVFGALWVTQAAVPVMREQTSGHILQVSSIGGILGFENVGIYNASKWALEGFSEALSKEVAAFNIHVTLVEPGPFDTEWGGKSAKRAKENAVYDKVREQRIKMRSGWKQGDPHATANAILTIVDAEQPPLRVFLGAQPFSWAKEQYEKRIENWQQWQPVAESAQGN